MAIPRSCGLLVWLSGEQEQGVLAEDPRRLRGLFVPPELPSPFRDVITNARMESAHVIWIAKRVVELTEMELALVLAHEHRHLQQYLYNRNIYFAGGVIGDYLLWRAQQGTPGNDFDNPIEWDAEACAREIVAARFSDDSVQRHYLGTDRAAFAAVKAAPSLAETAARIKTWILDNQSGIAEMLRRDNSVGGSRETFGLVDWTALSLGDLAQVLRP